MIKQKAIGLNSRNEANIYDENGMLPLITAPMYSVVDVNNYEEFLNRKIQVCLPRGELFKSANDYNLGFESSSLEDFKHVYDNLDINTLPARVCIDTANGNMPALHEAIVKAKAKHGDKLIIMAGNVSSVEAFLELAKTGVDYIRVGVGGGGACETTANTGVGQENLASLIRSCRHKKEEIKNLDNVKIVADGISSYIKHCQEAYGFNDNGYAAINKLLYVGADLVMIGRLFAQCQESAGPKKLGQVQYSGMSTQKEQQKYKSDNEIKASEGSVKWLPIRWSIDEWLNGSKNQDINQLSGFIPSLKSAMAYTGAKSLKEFKE